MIAQRREEEMAWISAMFRTSRFRLIFFSVASHGLWLLSSYGIWLRLRDPYWAGPMLFIVWMCGFCFAPLVSLCFSVFDEELAHRRWPRTHPVSYTFIASLVGSLAYYAFPICMFICMLALAEWFL